MTGEPTRPAEDAPVPDDDETLYAPRVRAKQERTTGRAARQSGAAKRRLRRLGYLVLLPLVRGVMWLIWKTGRIRYVGEEHLERYLREGKPVIVSYWHQSHLVCGQYLLRRAARGLKVGFLISPSEHGDVPAAIAERAGARALRGSSTRSGGQAMRDLYLAIRKEGTTVVTTADGPKGPVHKYKPGGILLARMTNTPIVPMAFAARPMKTLDTWDRFLLPSPFARIVIAFGEPVEIGKDVTTENVHRAQAEMEAAMTTTREAAEAALSQP